ncbi:MAG TPA: phospholipid carrier-dependent glycosyltransferase [Candidatus Dormibacteraeota bacterium]
MIEPRADAVARRHFDRWDAVALLALTVVAFVLRFYSPIMPDFFLHPGQGPIFTNCVHNTPINAKGDPGTLCGLAYPFNRGYPDQSGALSPSNGQVFDEVYFPVDAYNDIKGIELCKPSTVDCSFNYFDPEPPLAKMFIAAGEWGYGWYRAHLQAAKGDYMDLGFNTFGWRIAACIFGILCVPMMYLFARRLWPNRLFAIAAATLVCFDGMFFVQSRIGMIDIFPIFFILLAYFLFLVHIQSRTARSSLLSLVALGLVLGIGIASKWIVLAAWASMIFLLIARAVWHGFRRTPDEHVVPGGAPSRLYLAIAILAFLDIPVLIYVASWIPFFERGQFVAHWDQLFKHPYEVLGAIGDYNFESFRYHAALTATHPYGSPWWSWPFLSRPVLYYAEYTGLGTDHWTGQPLVAWMADLGNPWIWWTSLPCLVSLPYFIIRYKSFPAALILLGFITQYLPWSQISRVIFMYHMFGGLIFMILALAFVLAQIAERVPRVGKRLVVAHLAIAVASFFYFYPVWTALPISNSALYLAPGTPIWGPKIWFEHCPANPAAPATPALWCWQ